MIKSWIRCSFIPLYLPQIEWRFKIVLFYRLSNFCLLCLWLFAWFLIHALSLNTEEKTLMVLVLFLISFVLLIIKTESFRGSNFVTYISTWSVTEGFESVLSRVHLFFLLGCTLSTSFMTLSSHQKISSLFLCFNHKKTYKYSNKNRADDHHHLDMEWNNH